MSKIIELAKKLKALADKGIGGEKETAEKMLQQLRYKHQISMEDIEGELLKDYWFNISKADFQLWYQVVRKVYYEVKIYGPIPEDKIKNFKLAGNCMVSCTAAEYIEIEGMYHFYKRLYMEELDVFFSAFCTANDLLVTDPNQRERSLSEVTQQEVEEYFRIKSMSAKIKTGQFKKQLHNGKLTSLG